MRCKHSITSSLAVESNCEWERGLRIKHLKVCSHDPILLDPIVLDPIATRFTQPDNSWIRQFKKLDGNRTIALFPSDKVKEAD